MLHSWSLSQGPHGCAYGRDLKLQVCEKANAANYVLSITDCLYSLKCWHRQDGRYEALVRTWKVRQNGQKYFTKDCSQTGDVYLNVTPQTCVM